MFPAASVVVYWYVVGPASTSVGAGCPTGPWMSVVVVSVLVPVLVLVVVVLVDVSVSVSTSPSKVNLRR